MPAIRHICPHCQGRMRTITSKRLSALVREIYVDCMNVDCSFRGVIQMGFVRTLVPSLTPSAEVRLPIVERRANDIIVPAAQSGAGELPPASPTPPSSEAGPTRYQPMALN